MLFMVIEEFKEGNAQPVYERFTQKGRLAPPSVRYVDSWVTTDLARCYQIMECDESSELEAWIANWTDLVDFTVIPVLTSPEAAKQVARLE